MKIYTLKSNGSKKLLFLAGINRPINPSQVSKLAHSITEMGCVRPVVVAAIKFLTGKLELYIIDGQHLFHALMRNGLDIPYKIIDCVVDKKTLVETIALLNASSKSWTMQDYITAWASISPEYVKLQEYYNTYDVDLSTLAAIMCGRAVSGGGVTKEIKNGTYTIANEAGNKQLLDQVTDVFKVLPRNNRVGNRVVVGCYVQFARATGKKYNHTKFLANIAGIKKI